MVSLHQMEEKGPKWAMYDPKGLYGAKNVQNELKGQMLRITFLLTKSRSVPGLGRDG